MKQKSLRQLARELGVSASYLSQVKHGKRPASEKVLSSVKQNPNLLLNGVQVVAGSNPATPISTCPTSMLAQQVV